MTEPYALPDGWHWEPLEELAEVRTGVAKGRSLGKADIVQVPYLRVANVQNGYLDLREVKQIDIRRSEIERFSLKPKDILFTEGGDRDKLGRGAVWQGEIAECVHQNHVFAARLQSSAIMPEWVSLASQAQYARNYFLGVARQTVNLASINATNLRALPIPVPPLEEQQRILSRMDGLRGERQTAINALASALTLLNNLDQAILARAFRGEL
jgi:type I restriction enzyme S subunit